MTFSFLKINFLFSSFARYISGFVFSACRNSARTGAGGRQAARLVLDGMGGYLCPGSKNRHSRRKNRVRFSKIDRSLPVFPEKSVEIEVKMGIGWAITLVYSWAFGGSQRIVSTPQFLLDRGAGTTED
jgi:hypothetical protein